MPARKPTTLILLAACVVVAAAGCSSGRPDAIPAPGIGSPSGGPAQPPAISAVLNQYVQAAEEANVPASATVARTGARPTVALNGQSSPATVIKDQDEKTWQPGRYQLVVYCAGIGQVDATLRVGTASQTGNLQCGSTPKTVTVDVAVADAATGMAVHIIPTADTIAGVAYQVRADRG